MKYTIYCDMDGVLVDFERGYKELTGFYTKDHPDNNKFWQPIDAEGPTFWANLNWMSDGVQLWNYIKKYKPFILSSPSRSNTSRIGKEAWCKINIPGQYKELLLYPRHEKQNFSGQNRILIDDLPNTIQEWTNNGGIGILHKSALTTIYALKTLGL